MQRLSDLLDQEEVESYRSQSPWMFAGKDEPQWDIVYPHMQLKSVGRGAVLFTQNTVLDAVYIVKEGIVRLYMIDENGEEKHILISGPGCFLGTIQCVDGMPVFATAIAIEDCVLYTMSMEGFLALTREHPQIKDLMLQDLACKTRMMAAQLEELAFQSTATRVLKAIVRLTQKFGVSTPNGIKIDVRFTHLEMANLVRSNRVTVSRVFSNLIKQGVLLKKGVYYYVTDQVFIQKYMDIEG